MDSRFDERLWPSPAGWAIAPATGLGVALAVVPLSLPVAAGVAVVVTAVVTWALVRTSPRVAVVDGDLVAGRARIPARLLADPEALDRAATRQALGPDLDARSYVCLRSWVRTSVRVRVADPQDPTPSWLVSTRRPEELAAAVVAAGALAAPA